MAEKNIELDSVEIAAAVFGNCDRNIRLLENEFSVTAVCRGTIAPALGRTGQCCGGDPRGGGDASPDREPYPAGGSDCALLHQPGP